MDGANISSDDVVFEEQAYAISIKFPDSSRDYRVRCVPVDKTVKDVPSMAGKKEIKLNNLCADTVYKLTVLINDKKQGSEVVWFNVKKTTKKSSAKTLIAKMDFQQGTESLYILKPLKRTPLTGDIEEKYFKFGAELDIATEKTIYLLGESGSGKTTLVNAIANHLFGVHYADSFRIDVTSCEGSKSNTVCYKISPAVELGYKWLLNIIDVKSFPSGSDENNAIAIQPKIVLPEAQGKSIFCLVLRSTYRFLEKDTSMWESIISAGKHVIFVPLFTFCDGHNAEAIEALDEAKIPYHRDKCFHFSNGKMNIDDKETVVDWKKRSDSLDRLLKLEDDRTYETTAFNSNCNKDMKKETPKSQHRNADELPEQDNLKTNLVAHDSSTSTSVVQALVEICVLMKQVVNKLQGIEEELKTMREHFEKHVRKDKVESRE